LIQVFETERLTLRPYELCDSKDLASLPGDKEVARHTLNLPHPYTEENAVNWIELRKELALKGEGYTFAVVQKQDAQLVGTISINLEKRHNKGELGYWIGKDFWEKGYATEAAKQVIKFGFDNLELNRICAAAFKVNRASTKVLEKIGMWYEGTSRENVFKDGEYHDTVSYGILASDYRNM
jgi:ribosomal-protein-alanine N-acetyltransferase